VPDREERARFEEWVMRSRADAEDVTQEAILRAYRFFGNFRAGDARAWLLQIVRNCCYTWLQKNRPTEDVSEISEEYLKDDRGTPESLAIAAHEREQLAQALEKLPTAFREILVLRELEGCSYKEIAAITAKPIGTVMSALARARQQLRNALTKPAAPVVKENRLEL